MNDELHTILQKLEELRLSVARLEMRLQHHETHELRIKELELWRARATGMALGIGVMSSLVTSVVLWMLATVFGVSP